MTAQYTAKDIQVLQGLEAVRRRPGMYIGSTDQRGLHHLIYEIVDNSVDEAMAGHCSGVNIVIEKDGVVRVSDDGRGIPVDIHPTTGLSALETVMTTLHAGAKFGGGAYKVSGGLHGVGASVVNALSSKLQVEVRREGFVATQEYQKGITVGDLLKEKQPKDQPAITGTAVRFLPDTEIFSEVVYDFDILIAHFRQIAYLNKGLEINFVSLWHEEERDGDVERSYFFDGGLASLVRSINRHRKVLQDKPFYMLKSVDDTIVEAALQYNDGYNEHVLSFANCIPTAEGGTHLTGFRTALTRVINDYGHKQKFLKDDQANLTGEDVREGLTAVISVKLTDPQFEGQTKTKLGNAEVKSIVESLMGDALAQYLEEHLLEGKRIVENCVTAQKAREAAKKARELVIRKNALDGSSLPGKLSDCSERNPELSEIYVVEGESAGGSAKMGRDRRFQAILPLKGKILNVERVLRQPDKILGHEEIRALIAALGTGEGEEFNIEKLRYHTVIIMTDADVDGSHIRTLLLTFFFRRMSALIEEGHLFIAQPPLYRLAKGKTAEYVFSEQEKDTWVGKIKMESISAFSKDEKVKLTGKQLADLIHPLKSFSSALAELEKHGLPPDIATFLIERGNESKIDFESLANLRIVREWFEQFGYIVSSKPDPDTGEFSLDVSRPSVADSNSNGHRADFSVKLLQHPLLSRCYHVYPQVRQFAEGETFTVIKRGKEVGSNIPWMELADLLERSADSTGVMVQRYKGLGEMNPDQLWETTMDPQTRTMLQVSIPDALEADYTFTNLMGEEVKPRKDFINTYARSVKELDV